MESIIMAAVGAVGGVVFFKVNGNQYRCRGDVKIRWGGNVREDVTGADGQDHGWLEKPTPSGFDLTLTDSGDLSLATLMAITGATATLELNTGKVYVTENTRQVGELEHDAMEGKIPIKFGCSTIIEQLTGS
jgi:hypothetical protein